jgi:hypothetical protein
VWPLEVGIPVIVGTVAITFCSRGFENEDNKGKGKEAMGDGEEDCED